MFLIKIRIWNWKLKDFGYQGYTITAFNTISTAYTLRSPCVYYFPLKNPIRKQKRFSWQTLIFCAIKYMYAVFKQNQFSYYRIVSKEHLHLSGKVFWVSWELRINAKCTLKLKETKGLLKEWRICLKDIAISVLVYILRTYYIC